MVVLFGIAGGIIAALLIAGIGYGAYTLGSRISRKRQHAKQQAWLETFPFEQRQYIDVEAQEWYAKDIDLRRSMRALTFEEFTDRVNLYGGSIDPGPQIDLTEPENPFDMAGGFLNADDFNNESEDIQ